MNRLFCTSALVTLVGWAGQAAAQGAPAARGETAIDEVVVTAQRREQAIADVPISISVVSAQTLEEVGAKTGAAIQGLAPGLNINATASYGGSPVSIRGTSGLGGGEDPVAVYVDDIYSASGQFSVTALSDVASVEVVRGPQGTLQGRNATAGALIIRTAEPGPVFGGYIRASLEDPNAHRVEAAAGGPLTDTLLARMSMDWLNEEGWATNLFDGRKMGGIRMHNFRTVLLWEPTDAARVRLAVNYQDRIVSQPTVRWAQTTIAPPPGTAVPVPTPQIPLPADVQRRFLDDKVVNLNIEPRNHLKAPSLALQGQYDFGPMTLVSVTGASHFINEGVNDSDGLAMTDRQGRNFAKYTGSAFSQEVRLQSNGGGLFDWIVGAYYARYQNTMNFHIVNSLLSTTFNQMSHFESHQTNPNWAVFADATWRLTDQISLTGGVRYTEDTKDFRNIWTSYNTDTGAVVAPSPLRFAQETTWVDTSYRAKLAWEPTDDILVYLSYSKGFKGGGYNSFGVGNQVAYNPEILKSWEVGTKAYLWDRRAFVAAAAYDNTYDNLQVTSGVPTGGVVVTNAAAAKIKGFEVEGEVRPNDNWSFMANVAYVDAVFSSFPLAPGAFFGCCMDVSGNRLTNTPEWQYFLQAQYRTDLTPDWGMRATVNWRWRDEIFFTPAQQELAHLRGGETGELGARLSFLYAPQDLTFAIYGNNLNDSRVVAGMGLVFGYPQVFFNRPRVVGVSLEKRF